MVTAVGLVNVERATGARALLGVLLNLLSACLLLLGRWQLLPGLTLVILLTCLAVMHRDLVRRTDAEAA